MKCGDTFSDTKSAGNVWQFSHWDHMHFHLQMRKYKYSNISKLNFTMTQKDGVVD